MVDHRAPPVLALAAGLGAAALAVAPLRCQPTLRAATIAATADSFATEPGGFYLNVPGVAGQFRIFADGQWLERADGTARLSALLERDNGLDRNLFVVLEFSGRIAPGEAGYPPAGAPVTTLLPSAYAPSGPVDPATFVYYTTVTGTLTGLRALAGLRATATNSGPAQFGAGATNKNVLPGAALDLAVSVVQPPTSESFAPTGPAELRCNLLAERAMCATHVDGVVQYAGNTDRTAFALPGVADDYLLLPRGTWTEADDGTATLTATLKSESNYADAWELQLGFAGRVDPGDPGHPPAGGPVTHLLTSIYALQGGPVDPGAWRYYTQATGTLTGLFDNAGGLIQLTTAAALQAGVGGGQGNVFFGLGGVLAATIVQQPGTHMLTITGDAMLHANVGASCILPPPQVLAGSGQTIDSVTQDRLYYTGVDLGFVEQGAIGPNVFGNDERRWLSGHVRVVDHQTVEVSIPQGLVPATYPMALLNATRLSNPLSVTIQAPATRTLRTENDRMPGEPQHWVVHQGDLTGPVITLLVVSLSNAPSTIPGVVSLQIGNGFADYLLLGVAVHDPATGVAVVLEGSIPPTLVGMRLYSQAALLDSNGFPLHESDVWFTDY